jgi:hypothetical protein
VTFGDEVSDLEVARVALDCTLQEPGGGEPWRLSLRTEMESLRSDGTLARGASAFTVTPTYAVEGWKKVQLPVPSGFLFARGGRWVAAAEWWRPSALRLDPALDEGDRRLLAAASAAVLLSNSLTLPGL